MSSPFWPALTALDVNLQTIQSQLDCLEAAVEVDDSKLRITLTEANRQAASLRNLIRAERPDADWSDRTALDQLLRELEVSSIARLDQQRRAKLLALANELNAGRAQHRLDSRTKALNRTRLEAVQLLRAEAGQKGEAKDLPGPNASKWLCWACSLRDATDGLVLANLRRDFGEVERFAGEMEESYWIPGEGVDETSVSSEPSILPEDAFLREPVSSCFSMAAMPVPVTEEGTGEGPGGALDQPETHSGAKLQTGAGRSPEPFIGELAARTTVDSSRELAKPDFEVPNVAPPAFLSAAVEMPSNFGEPILRKKRSIMWTVVTALFVALGIVAGIYYSYFHARPGIKSYGTVAGASIKVGENLQDSDIQKDIEDRLATIKASSIRVTVHDGIATLSGQSSSDEEVHAITLALQAQGVKDVRSELQIQRPNTTLPASSAKSP